MKNNFSTSIKALTSLVFLSGCANLCQPEPAEIKDIGYFEKNGRVMMTAIETDEGSYVVPGDVTPHVKGFVWAETCRGNTVVRFRPDGVGFGVAR